MPAAGSFSDFLILTRKKTNRIAPYAAALEALNIPVEVSGAGAFGESRGGRGAHDAAARAGRSAGSAVARRRPAWSALRHQRSRAVRVQAGRRLVQHLPAGRRRRGGVAAPAGRPCRASRSTPCNQYYRWTRVLPAGRARSNGSSKHTGYLALAATTPGGVEAGDLLHAVDRVRQVVEDGGSLADAADALEADREATSEVESLPLEPGRTDVVRLMNLHKAKGLEANVVFLADPAGGVKPRVDVHIERRGQQAGGWLKVVRRVGDVVRGEAARRARRLGRARSSRAAVSRGGGGPAALRRGHACARAARRQPAGGPEGSTGAGAF